MFFWYLDFVGEEQATTVPKYRSTRKHKGPVQGLRIVVVADS